MKKHIHAIIALSALFNVLVATSLFAAIDAPSTKDACNAAVEYIWDANSEKCVKDPCYGNIIRVNCKDEGNPGSGIYESLNLILNILTVGVGIAATGGAIFAAYRYTYVRDNAENAASAKKMLIGIIIGLIVWAVFWVLLQWLLPGGLIGA